MSCITEEQLDQKLDKLLTDLRNYMNALHQDILKKFDDYPTKKDLDMRLEKFATKEDLKKLERRFDNKLDKKISKLATKKDLRRLEKKIDYIHEDMKAQNVELKALRELNEEEHKLFHKKLYKFDQDILENPIMQDRTRKHKP